MPLSSENYLKETLDMRTWTFAYFICSADSCRQSVFRDQRQQLVIRLLSSLKNVTVFNWLFFLLGIFISKKSTLENVRIYRKNVTITIVKTWYNIFLLNVPRPPAVFRFAVFDGKTSAKRRDTRVYVYRLSFSVPYHRISAAAFRR